MTYPQVQFVSEPTSTATVLFDFNDTTASPRREVLDDFSVGAPELEGEYDAIDPLYGERLVSFSFRITGTKAAALGVQSALARHLMTSQSWLRFRLTASSRLLFFRTYRANPGELSLELVRTTMTTKSEAWTLEVEIPCEPFAYGEKVTQPALTVTNDPTTGTHPMRLVLPAIVGDAPAPLRLDLTGFGALRGFRDYLLMSHAGLTQKVATNVAVGTGDGLTAGTDTGAAVAAADFIGGSYRPVTFATNSTLTTRLSGNLPAVTPGRYRVMLRMAQLAPAKVQFVAYKEGPVRTLGYDLGGTPAWFDLGDFELPPRRPLNAGDQGPDVAAPFSLRISREDVSGTVRIDHILLVPLQVADTVESRALVIDDTFNYGTTETYTWDGESESVWMKVTSSGALYFPSGPTPSVAGVFPRGVPGASQVLTLFNKAETDGSSDDNAPSSTTSVTVSYYPRFLYIGDS